MCMRPITMLQAQFRADTQQGESLRFENCKGGYLSDIDDYGLKVVGKTFQNGTPAPDTPIDIQCVKSGTKVQVCGKNLANQEILISHGAVKREDGSYYFKYSSTPSDKIFWENTLLIEGQFTISFDIKFVKSNNIIGCYPAICYTDGTIKTLGYLFETLADNTWGSCKFVTAENKTVSYIGWGYGTGSTQTYINNYQLEPGNTATEYEPYQGNEITVPCDLYKGDIWYPVSGKVVKRFEMIELDGNTDIWRNDPVTSDRWLFGVTVAHKLGSTGWSTHFGEGWGLGQYQPGYGTERLFFNLTGYIDSYDPDLAKTFCETQKQAGTPIQLYYEPPESIIEQYDPQPVFAPMGIVNVLQTPVDLSADLSATCLIRR